MPRSATAWAARSNCASARASSAEIADVIVDGDGSFTSSTGGGSFSSKCRAVADGATSIMRSLKGGEAADGASGQTRRKSLGNLMGMGRRRSGANELGLRRRAMPVQAGMADDRREVGSTLGDDRLDTMIQQLWRYHRLIAPAQLSKRKFWWDMATIAFVMWNCFLVPIELCFRTASEDLAMTAGGRGVKVFDSLIDVFFFFDICINFRTTCAATLARVRRAPHPASAFPEPHTLPRPHAGWCRLGVRRRRRSSPWHRAARVPAATSTTTASSL
jgi:hypothetical protein